MSEEKRFDEFEIDVDELESVAGGEISGEVIQEILNKINVREREMQEEVAKIRRNMYLDLRDFISKGKDFSDDEFKKFFEEKYGFTF